MEPHTTQDKNTDFIETLLSSFEARIEKIETVFSISEAVTESSNALLNDFRNSIKELRQERVLVNSILRENLAKCGSLRKNDYDILMDDVFQLLNDKEKEAENQFYMYLENQKSMVHFLRQGILEIKNTSLDENRAKIEEFKAKLDITLKAQQQHKKQAITKFLEFQKIHKIIINNFKKLIDKDVHIFCKDIKNVKKHLIEELV